METNRSIKLKFYVYGVEYTAENHQIITVCMEISKFSSRVPYFTILKFAVRSDFYFRATLGVKEVLQS